MILVTGANGQLGQCFRQLASRFPDAAFCFAGSGDLDITDSKAVDRFFKAHPFTWVLNCAAYTAVDKAESEPAQARKVNVSGVRNLAAACAARQIPMIHFSTDYVYHSRQNTPFLETDPVHPQGVYARTKRAGEIAAQKAYPGIMIIRTSWVYSPFGNNFVKTMLRLGQERPELRVVFDQIGSPTYAPDLAAAIMSIIRRNPRMEEVAGIWHYSNEGVASWYDFARAIFEMKGIDCVVKPIETKDFPTPAKRPPFSLLNKSKIKTAFGLEIPYWRDSLRECLSQ